MANKTVPDADAIHGQDPQFLVEKILRMKIIDSTYWKEHCFALTSESLVDKAVDLEYVGGSYGGARKPSQFMCLILKMLQIQPEKEIIDEFIQNDDYKYVRLLGAFYLRLTGKAVRIYNMLEPLLNDYRKARLKQVDGRVVLSTIDDLVDKMLTTDYMFDISLPHLPKRHLLEATGRLAALSVMERQHAMEDIDDKQKRMMAREGLEIDEDAEEDEEESAKAKAERVKREAKEKRAADKAAKAKAEADKADKDKNADDETAKRDGADTGDKDKGKEGEKDNEKERERETGRKRGSRSKSRSKSRSRGGWSRDRSGSRSRRRTSRDRDDTRDSSRRRERRRSRSRSKSRSKSRSQSRERDSRRRPRRSRSDSRDRRRSRRSRSRSRGRDQDKHNQRGRSSERRGRKRSRSRS